MMQINNSVREPIQSGLSKHNSSKAGVPLNVTLNSVLNNELENLDIIVRYKQSDLFAQKKLRLDGARLGLFGLQEFEEDNCLGFTVEICVGQQKIENDKVINPNKHQATGTLAG
ncbi:hypothetical protein ACA910_009550 [Epithemia clementina (nom. ined.)]